jgi:hypothetical protein
VEPADILDRRAIAEEMDQARQTFHRLLDQATDTSLRRRSNGTKWTNEQLLFHVLFGYLITRALLPLARIFGRLPDGASKAFAQLLDAARGPFHLINYLGSCAGARVISYSHMRSSLDRVIAALEHRLESERGAALRRGMHYPTTWDPFFTDYMTLADLYRYPTQHFNYHRRQLTLTNTESRPMLGKPGDGLSVPTMASHDVAQVLVGFPGRPPCDLTVRAG